MEIDKRYTFSVHGGNSSRPSYVGVKLLNKFNYKTACMFETIDRRAQQMAPYLPEGTPRDHTRYQYFQFEDKNGKPFIVANWWINDNTITEAKGLDYRITIHNTTPERMQMVRDQLRTLGFDFDIEE